MSRKRKREKQIDELPSVKKPQQQIPDPGPMLMIQQSKELIAPWCRPHSGCMYLTSAGYPAPDHHQKPTHRLGCESFIPNYDRNISHCSSGCDHTKRKCPMILLGCLMQVARHFSDSEHKSPKYGIFEGTPLEMRELYIPLDAILELIDIAVASGHCVDQLFETVYQRSSFDEPMTTVQTCLASAVFLFDGDTNFGHGLEHAASLISKLLAAGANPNVPIIGHVVHPSSMTKSSFTRNYDNALHVLVDMIYRRFRHSTYTIGHLLDYVPDENEWKGIVVERKQGKYDSYPEDFKQNVADVQLFKKVLELLVAHGADFNIWSASKGQYHSNAWIQCMFVVRDHIRRDLQTWCTNDVLSFVSTCSEKDCKEASAWADLVGTDLMRKVCRMEADNKHMTNLMVLCLAQWYLSTTKIEKDSNLPVKNQVTAQRCLNRLKFLHISAQFDAPGFKFSEYVNRFH